MSLSAPSRSLAAPVATRNSLRAAARYQESGKESLSNERLVVMLCERLLKDIDDAHGAIVGKDFADAHGFLVHAQEIVDALQRSLDVTKWSGAQDLWDIYDFAQRELVAANITKDAQRVLAVRAVLVPIVEGWQEAWKMVMSPTGSSEH